nr:hypothetical protein [Clostridioides sp.]
MKKIRILSKDLDMTIDTHNEMVVRIDDVIFIHNEEFTEVDIMLGERDQGADHIDTVDNEITSKIVDLEDLKRFAINWFFENVEITKKINPANIDYQLDEVNLNRKLCLTEKDLYCIARHIQTEVVEKNFKERIGIEDCCVDCKYKKECFGSGACFAHWDTFSRLGEITGIKIYPGTEHSALK